MLRSLLVITALVLLVSGKPTINHPLPNQSPNASDSMDGKTDLTNDEITPEVTQNDAVNELKEKHTKNGYLENNVHEDNIKAPQNKHEVTNKNQAISSVDRAVEHEMRQHGSIIPMTSPYAALTVLVSGKPTTNHGLLNQLPNASNSVDGKADGTNGKRTPEMTNNGDMKEHPDTRPIGNGYLKNIPANNHQAPKDKPEVINKDQVTSLLDKAAEREMGQEAGLQVPLIAPYDGRAVEVAFEAISLTDRELQGEQDVVIFDNVQFNIGDAYDPVTSQFTVPVDGVYMVHWAVRSQSSWMSFHLQTIDRKISDLVIPNYYSTSQTVVGGVSDSRLVSLNTGDILYVDGCGNTNANCPDGAMMSCQEYGCAFGAALLYPLSG